MMLFNSPINFSVLFTDISSAVLLPWVLGAAILYWSIYTLVAVYHWLAYAHNPGVAAPSIALHVFVSLVLIGYAATGAW